MTTPLQSEEESPLFEVVARFGLSLDRLNGAVERQNRMLERQAALRPIPTVIERNIVLAAATTTGTVDFGTPFAGHRWVVRLLGVVENPVGIAAPVAAVVTWYVGPSVLVAAGTLVATNARWQQRQIPDIERFTSDSIHVRSGQSLVAGLASMPAGGSSTALIAAVDDYLEGVKLDA